MEVKLRLSHYGGIQTEGILTEEGGCDRRVDKAA
jgi:hypothetical protein